MPSQIATPPPGVPADAAARRSVPTAVAARAAEEPRILRQAPRAPELDAAELLAGLVARPASSDPKFFYDAQGCALFDAICQLEEYYPTRTEAAIFARHRGEIARQLPRGAQWIDLGAGDGGKSRDWLPAVMALRYIGVDIADVWLGPAVTRIAEAQPGLEAIGVVADLTQPLALHALLAETPDSPALFFYPGSSIGNFAPPRALELLAAIRSHCDARGRLLIGVDLVKDAALLEAAYDDALGVTAAFNLNLLRVANRLLDADFDLRGFEHVARFDAETSRIEMHLRARREQTVHFERPTPASRHYAAGETIFTERSYKYTRTQFAQLLGQAGFSQYEFWTDPMAGFGVFVAAP